MAPKVILIGPPGAGKSVIGKSLAQKLKSDFADTDNLIESETGKSVSQIFIEEGEAAFRDIEARVVRESLETREGVLSLGGGAILREETQQAVRASGAQVVFLDVSIAVAAPRIGFNRDRPLLLNNPRQQWQKLMDERRPVYEAAATLHINVGEKTVAAVTSEIIDEIRGAKK